ncbi:MAG TPA: hypothetical protein VE953_17715 [Terriglobales bacterium]|nr:hypothetical protein [Terriglobales bacterium]
MPAPDGWRQALNGDPLPWLLEEEAPAVRHLALRWLLDEPESSPAARRARAAAMRADPIASTLAAQHPDGYWVKPGSGYGPKYTGTVWSLMFLDQAGADPGDRGIQRACAYVLAHTQAPGGGFGMSGTNSGVVHCLHGNLLRALVGFGWLDDERVRTAVEWQARSITGDGFDGWHRWATSGPGFSCGINGGLPCAWGAIKALRGLSRIPPEQRSPLVLRAIGIGVEFLLSRDPAVADYPAQSRVSPNWFKLGFPSGYVADMLQNLEVLAEFGHAGNPRLTNGIDAVLAKQDGAGRWKNEHAYERATWVPFERTRSPSKWVTLRACRVLRAALGDSSRR